MGRSKSVSDEELLAIVRDLFAAEGYAVSTRKLAFATGLSQASLIQRFGSKNHLFIAAMLPPVLPLDIFSTRAALPSLSDIAVDIVREIAARIPIVLQLASSPAATPDLIATAHARLGVPQFAASLAEWIQQSQSSGAIRSEAEPQVIAEALLIGAHGFTLTILSSSSKDLPVDAIRRFAATLCGAP